MAFRHKVDWAVLTTGFSRHSAAARTACALCLCYARCSCKVLWCCKSVEIIVLRAQRCLVSCCAGIVFWCCLHSACLCGSTSWTCQVYTYLRCLCCLVAHAIGRNNLVFVVNSFVAASPAAFARCSCTMFCWPPPGNLRCRVSTVCGYQGGEGQLQTSNIGRLQYCNPSIRKDRVLYLATLQLQCLLKRGQESWQQCHSGGWSSSHLPC